MKILHLSYSDINGGAARAAYRIHRSLVASGADSSVLVENASTDDFTVQRSCAPIEKILKKIRPHLVKPIVKLLGTKNTSLHSVSLLPSGIPKMINGSPFDVINLHWINGEMLSVSDIPRIKKPLFWTLHDMWPICGAEHYAADDRWREGYRHDNRPTNESGFDLNRWTWLRKVKSWKHPINIVTPSHWLARCVRGSKLMRDWPVSVIHNPIDTEKWKPIDRAFARDLLGLPQRAILLLFGAAGGGQDPRKGFDLLRDALAKLTKNFSGLELLIFGQGPPKNPPDHGFPVHYAGHLHDDLSLRVMYSAADAFVLPSRQDNLPNTGVEAMACGTPIIAFETCGLSDLVQHKETGWLARPFDTEDLAAGIRWVLSNAERHCYMRDLSRRTAVAKFSYPIISKKYKELYLEKLGI